MICDINLSKIKINQKNMAAVTSGSHVKLSGYTAKCVEDKNLLFPLH